MYQKNWWRTGTRWVQEQYHPYVKQCNRTGAKGAVSLISIDPPCKDGNV